MNNERTPPPKKKLQLFSLSHIYTEKETRVNLCGLNYATEAALCSQIKQFYCNFVENNSCQLVLYLYVTTKEIPVHEIDYHE